MQTGIKSCAKVFSKVKGTAWSLLLFQSTCSCLCPDSATYLCASAILRAQGHHHHCPSLPTCRHSQHLPTAQDPTAGPRGHQPLPSDAAAGPLPTSPQHALRGHGPTHRPASQPTLSLSVAGTALVPPWLRCSWLSQWHKSWLPGEPLMGQHAALGHCQTLEYPAAFSMGCWVSSNPPLVKLPGLLPVKLRRRPSKLKKK